MKRIFILSVLSGLIILLAQCSPKPRTSMTSTAATDKAKIAEVKEKYSEEDMSLGKKLFESHCDNCHKLKVPESRSVDKWEKVLPRMVNRSKLNDKEAGQVRAYVLTHAKVE